MNGTRPKAIIAFPILESVAARARGEFDLQYDPTTPLETEKLVRLANEIQAEALMVLMRHKMTEAVIAKLPESVRVISTASVGFDHIDVAAAKKRGIVVTNTPDVLTDATADLGLLLLLAASRRLSEAAATMASGWGQTQGFGERLGRDLRGKTLAIYGMGRIGQAIADRARAFGMKIVYSNRKPLPRDLEKDATYFATLEAMLPHADALSLNAPGTKETEKIMNERTFALLPKGAIFVNVARGSLVDEDALINVLKSGHLFAAGLDVFANEPQIDPRFLSLPNVVLTPHVGSATLETREQMGLRALENMRAVVRGETATDALEAAP